MSNLMMIGQLAAATGTKINTIRFYEDIGLMPKAERTTSGRRTYGKSDFVRLSFIRHGRSMGFSVNDIRSLMALSDQPERDCAEAAAIARRHLDEVEDRIASLQRLRVELQKLATSCDGGKAAQCRVIETIAESHLQ